jgi:hypothetical protein
MAQERGRGNTFKILMAQCNSGRSPILLSHGSGKREEQHLQDHGISSYFPLLSIALPFFRPLFSFLFRHREGDKEKMASEVRCAWATTSFELCDGDGQAGWAPSDVVRGLVNLVYLPPQLLAHHASDTNKGYRSCYYLRVRRQNPLSGSEPPRATRVRDEVTQRVASCWHVWCSIEGIRHRLALYLSPKWEVSIIPSVWAGIVLSRFFAWIFWERRAKPPDQNLIARGELAPV